MTVMPSPKLCISADVDLRRPRGVSRWFGGVGSCASESFSKCGRPCKGLGVSRIGEAMYKEPTFADVPVAAASSAR